METVQTNTKPRLKPVRSNQLNRFNSEKQDLVATQNAQNRP